MVSSPRLLITPPTIRVTMSKLILSLLFSVSACTALAQEEEKRDLTGWVEEQNPTTASNPNTFVTGTLAHINFEIDPETELGKKIIKLLQFFTTAISAQDEETMKKCTEQFEAFSGKEQQFLQVLAVSSNQLQQATQELVAEYTAQQ